MIHQVVGVVESSEQMSSRKKVHYVGTDPNPDNFLDDLGISRYEYGTKFYNDNCVDDFSDKLTTFFDVKKQGNTYELFQDGSELISNNPKFQKYKGKLDISFTSPPCFNREQYSQDENQSFKIIMVNMKIGEIIF